MHPRTPDSLQQSDSSLDDDNPSLLSAAHSRRGCQGVFALDAFLPVTLLFSHN